MCHSQHLSRRNFVSQGLGAALVLGGVPRAFRVPRFDELSHAERPYLEVALQAWRWIESSRIVTDDGITWPADPLNPDSVGLTFYTHSPGVVPFALELFHSTGDEQYLAAARQGVDHLAASLEDMTSAGLYTGIAGLAFVFEETYRASERALYRHHAERATALLLERAEAVGEGKAWPVSFGDGRSREVNDIVSGTTGTGLALLYLKDAMGHPGALQTAVSAGYRLVELAVPTETGLTWAMWPGYEREMPNFSHGTAGIAFYLASLYRLTQEDVFLDSALKGAAYLESIATLQDGGYLIRHHTPGGDDLFYLSWCHGPVGTNRLFYELGKATGDDKWTRWMHMGARGIMNTGGPEHRTPGFWENVSQCGGSAGLGEFFLSLYRTTGEVRYRRYAHRLTADLMGRSTSEAGGAKWTQSEHRVQPDLLVAQTGFMQGAAGIGKYFLHLDSMTEKGDGPVVVLPDAPY